MQADELGADEDGEALEEDAADAAARRKALAKAREEAELKLRSQVCPALSRIGQALCMLSSRSACAS